MTPPREWVRAAIRRHALPVRAPDRIFGGQGDGSPCAICGQSVNADELEYELEFDTGSRGDGADVYHVHLGCYSAWKTECQAVSEADKRAAHPART